MEKKTTQKNLFKMLEYVGSITLCGDWRDVQNLVSAIAENPSCVLSKQRLEPCRVAHPLDLTDIKTWSTYEKCFDLVFSVSENKIKCDALIFNGDNFHGYREEKRFKASILLDKKYVKMIEYNIENAFDRKLNAAHETFLHLQRELWKDSFKEELLGVKK